MVREFGREVRRLHLKILADGVEGMDEVNWPSAEIHIGIEVLLRIPNLA